MAFDYPNIPVRIADALTRYVEHRLHPGNFLVAALANDLQTTVALADTLSASSLLELTEYIRDNVPEECRGSANAVFCWLHESVH